MKMDLLMSLLSDLSSLSQPCEDQHEDMVLTKQEPCQ
jgi:hypothetical protein